MKKQFTFPPRRILVPVDFSNASAIAWKSAKTLAAPFGARVEGLFVHDWTFYPELMPSAVDVNKAVADLRARLGASKEELSAAAGSPSGTIISWGRELDFDLIVMGTHGRTGLERLMLGSVAENVLRSCPIPVLAVRRPLGKIRTVLAPVNFEPYALEALKSAAEIAQVLGAALKVLHVVSAPVFGGPDSTKGPRHLLTDAVNRLPAGARGAGKPKTELAFGPAAEQIALAARSVDLLVLAAHRKGFLDETLMGTTSERLLRHCETPLLAIPSGGAPERAPGKAAAAEGKER